MNVFALIRHPKDFKVAIIFFRKMDPIDEVARLHQKFFFAGKTTDMLLNFDVKIVSDQVWHFFFIHLVGKLIQQLFNKLYRNLTTFAHIDTSN
jgi:hypothetical protein